MKIIFTIVVLLSISARSTVAQEHDEALAEIADELRGAQQVRTRLTQQLKIAERRVELLTEMRALRKKLAELPELFEKAEDSGDERRIERLEEQAEVAEFEFEFLRASRELLERRSELVDLLGELPPDNKALQHHGKQLEKMADHAEGLLEELFEVYREGPEEKERELEEEMEELEETFERSREVLGLRMELIDARNEGDDEWIRELEEELRELDALEDELNEEDEQPRQSFVF